MPLHFLTVERLDRFLSLKNFRQFHKRKTSRRAGIQVADDLNRFHFEAKLLEPQLEFVFRCNVGKIANIKPCHSF